MNFLAEVVEALVWLFYIHNFTHAGAGIVPTENKCPATLHEVRVTHCTAHPCKIQRGREYKVEIVFSPSQNTSTASMRCETRLYGQPYRIPEHPICPDITPDPCPLNESGNYTYTEKFVVPYFIPTGQYPIRCGMLDDQKFEQLCLYGVGHIV